MTDWISVEDRLPDWGEVVVRDVNKESYFARNWFCTSGVSERHFLMAICIKLGIDYSELKELAEAIALDEYMTGQRG